MTVITPIINTKRLKDIAYSAACMLIIALCLFIVLEAITLQTLNTTLLGALTLLLPLV